MGRGGIKISQQKNDLIKLHLEREIFETENYRLTKAKGSGRSAQKLVGNHTLMSTLFGGLMMVSQITFFNIHRFIYFIFILFFEGGRELGLFIYF